MRPVERVAFADLLPTLREEVARRKANVDYNANNVVQRAGSLMRILERGFGFGMAGKRLVDIGSGFGGIALWAATDGGAASARLFDIMEANAASARNVAARHGLDHVTAHTASIDALEIEPGSADLILAIDVCYQRNYDLRRFFSQCHRALAENGLLLVKTINRMAGRDQLHGIPGIQMLANSTADRLLRTLWPGGLTFSQFRVPAVADLAALMEEAGFSPILYTASGGVSGSRPLATHPFAGFVCLIGGKSNEFKKGEMDGPSSRAAVAARLLAVLVPARRSEPPLARTVSGFVDDYLNDRALVDRMRLLDQAGEIEIQDFHGALKRTLALTVIARILDAAGVAQDAPQNAVPSEAIAILEGLAPRRILGFPLPWRR